MPVPHTHTHARAPRPPPLPLPLAPAPRLGAGEKGVPARTGVGPAAPGGGRACPCESLRCGWVSWWSELGGPGSLARQAGRPGARPGRGPHCAADRAKFRALRPRESAELKAILSPLRFPLARRLDTVSADRALSNGASGKASPGPRGPRWRPPSSPLLPVPVPVPRPLSPGRRDTARAIPRGPPAGATAPLRSPPLPPPPPPPVLLAPLRPRNSSRPRAPGAIGWNTLSLR